MTEETQYDDSIECHHSYDERCHTTYTTQYVPQQVKIKFKYPYSISSRLKKVLMPLYNK